MRDPIGFMEPGKKHSQVHLDGPGLCPLCLERDIDGREGGAKTQLVEEIMDGVKTGKWIARMAGAHTSSRAVGAHGGHQFPLLSEAPSSAVTLSAVATEVPYQRTNPVGPRESDVFVAAPLISFPIVSSPRNV